jgi:hypothetical protein
MPADFDPSDRTQPLRPPADAFAPLTNNVWTPITVSDKTVMQRDAEFASLCQLPTNSAVREMQEAQSHAPAAPLSACQCARCGDERWAAAHPGKQHTPFNGPPSMTMMVLCAICGNKRCPHATDHRHACTGSNEPGQPGSSYGPPAVKEAAE